MSAAGTWALGSLLLLKGSNKECLVRFVGRTHFSETEDVLYGVELVGAMSRTGVHSGKFKGVRYFDCAPLSGLFVRQKDVERQLNASDFRMTKKRAKDLEHAMHMKLQRKSSVPLTVTTSVDSGFVPPPLKITHVSLTRSKTDGFKGRGPARSPIARKPGPREIGQLTTSTWTPIDYQLDDDNDFLKEKVRRTGRTRKIADRRLRSKSGLPTVRRAPASTRARATVAKPTATTPESTSTTTTTSGICSTSYHSSSKSLKAASKVARGRSRSTGNVGHRKKRPDSTGLTRSSRVSVEKFEPGSVATRGRRTSNTPEGLTSDSKRFVFDDEVKGEEEEEVVVVEDSCEDFVSAPPSSKRSSSKGRGSVTKKRGSGSSKRSSLKSSSKRRSIKRDSSSKRKIAAVRRRSSAKKRDSIRVKSSPVRRSSADMSSTLPLRRRSSKGTRMATASGKTQTPGRAPRTRTSLVHVRVQSAGPGAGARKRLSLRKAESESSKVRGQSAERRERRASRHGEGVDSGSTIRPRQAVSLSKRDKQVEKKLVLKAKGSKQPHRAGSDAKTVVAAADSGGPKKKGKSRTKSPVGASEMGKKKKKKKKGKKKKSAGKTTKSGTVKRKRIGSTVEELMSDGILSEGDLEEEEDNDLVAAAAAATSAAVISEKKKQKKKLKKKKKKKKARKKQTKPKTEELRRTSVTLTFSEADTNGSESERVKTTTIRLESTESGDATGASVVVTPPAKSAEEMEGFGEEKTMDEKSEDFSEEVVVGSGGEIEVVGGGGTGVTPLHQLLLGMVSQIGFKRQESMLRGMGGTRESLIEDRSGAKIKITITPTVSNPLIPASVTTPVVEMMASVPEAVAGGGEEEDDDDSSSFDSSFDSDSSSDSSSSISTPVPSGHVRQDTMEKLRRQLLEMRMETDVMESAWDTLAAEMGHETSQSLEDILADDMDAEDDAATFSFMAPSSPLASFFGDSE